MTFPVDLGIFLQACCHSCSVTPDRAYQVETEECKKFIRIFCLYEAVRGWDI